MTNADKFKAIFGLYATELWAKPEKDFLEWLNADAELFGISEQLDCSDCVNHGGDWECDHVHCRKGGTDAISRADAINELLRWEKIPGYNDGERNMMACAIRMLSLFPSAQPEQRWIPVTPETEPKENGEYLVTRESKGLYRYIDIVKKSNVTDKMASDIVAYMPLPEPWKGEGVE